MKQADLINKKTDAQPKTLRALSPNECRRIAAGALTMLGGNLNTRYRFHKTDSSTDQRISLTRHARLIDY